MLFQKSIFLLTIKFLFIQFQARAAGRPIFYVDETFLYAHEQNAREWQDANNRGRKRGSSGGSGKGDR